LLYALRQSLLMVIYILVVNKNIKHYVVDKTAKSDLKNLVTRSIFGTATSLASLVVIKEFDITMYAISSNLGPIMTVIFAYFLLKDKI
jgi:drug/metabolite transporter (DMT)-like permease